MSREVESFGGVEFALSPCSLVFVNFEPQVALNREKARHRELIFRHSYFHMAFLALLTCRSHLQPRHGAIPSRMAQGRPEQKPA